MRVKRKFLVKVLVTYTLMVVLLAAGILTLTLLRYYRSSIDFQKEREVEIGLHIASIVRSHYQKRGSLVNLDDSVGALFRLKPDSPLLNKKTNPYVVICHRGKNKIYFTNLQDDFSLDEIEEKYNNIVVTLDGDLLVEIFVNTMIKEKYKHIHFPSEMKKSMCMILIYTVLLILFTIGLGFYFILKTMKPLSQMQDAFEKVSQNQFSVRLKYKPTNELRVLLNSFNAMMQKLEEGDNARRQLTADISHDLRTPLTLIRGRIELLQQGVYQFDSKQLDFLLEEIEHLANMIESWRQMARLEAGSLEINMEELELNQFFSMLYGSFLPMKESKGLKFELNLAKDLLYIMGDRENLTRAFSNLIVNSVKFSKLNGLVRVTLTKKEDEACIVIYDDGIGIPEEKLPYVFDRFYKADSSRGIYREGTGLGLSICRSIINAHGGKISVVSQEGVFTEFTIRLPLR